MRLITTGEVRQQLQMDDMQEINDAIETSLDSATVSLSSMLRTPFDAVTQYQDIFYTEGMEQRPGLFRCTLLLSRGFVAKAPAPVISMSTVYAGLGGSGTAVDITGQCKINYDLGEVVVLDQGYSHCYISVVYDAGLPIDAEDSGLYSPASVPEWLRRLTMTTTIIALDQNPVIRFKDQPGIQVTEAQKNLDLMVAPYIRYRPQALHPV